MGPQVGHRFSWWTLPVGVLLWAVAVWAAGLVRVWGAPLAGGYLRVRVAAGPLALAGALVAALALVVFADHLRRARGLRD
ncbi:MAG: hypothetical protein ACJ79S_16895 [Gemmatimonadaceae bacterium]